MVVEVEKSSFETHNHDEKVWEPNGGFHYETISISQSTLQPVIKLCLNESKPGVVAQNCG